MILVIIILIILGAIAWNHEESSRFEADKLVREDSEFRDIPGNRYYRG